MRSFFLVAALCAAVVSARPATMPQEHRNDIRVAQLVVPTTASLLEGEADQTKSGPKAETSYEARIHHINDILNAPTIVSQGKTDMRKYGFKAESSYEARIHLINDILAAAPLPSPQDHQTTTNGQPRLNDLQKREPSHHHQQNVTEPDEDSVNESLHSASGMVIVDDGSHAVPEE